mmetsp:Transcript_30423/g.57046  ORF Transcript_30423/g.57046 Transcript_30423/m.57046 type:complete len:393 (-) Transcript_30423:1669-2847(-)
MMSSGDGLLREVVPEIATRKPAVDVVVDSECEAFPCAITAAATSSTTESREPSDLRCTNDEVRFEHVPGNKAELAFYMEDGERVLEEEARALQEMSKNLRHGDFGHVVALIRQVIGRVVVTGVGKSGIVGRKIAATLASTGTPACFVHAADAAHGDLGMITQEDVILAVSKSGETSELRPTVHFAMQTEVPLVAITQRPQSMLGRAAQYVMLLPDVPEACHSKVAPTTSSTATMALGDALAVALSRARGFSLKEFRVFHPGGNLGLLTKRVDSIMAKSPPLCSHDTTMAQALITMTMKRQCCVGVTNDMQQLVGIITNKDIQMAGCSSMDRPAHSIMSPLLVTLDPRESGHDALQCMVGHNIFEIFVVHPTSRVPVGFLTREDLLGCSKINC